MVEFSSPHIQKHHPDILYLYDSLKKLQTLQHLKKESLDVSRQYQSMVQHTVTPSKTPPREVEFADH